MTSPTHLKNIGLKATLPRLKILQIFNEAASMDDTPHHLTADDVYRKLIEEGVDIGLATVYRVLTQFEQSGLLLRRNFDSGKAVFELKCDTHHDHLVCLDCGHVEEFFDEEIDERQRNIAKARGFDLHEHALAMYGRCKRESCPNRKTLKQNEF